MTPGEDDRTPHNESVTQELQADLFYIFGQVFMLTVSVLMGLIMITHLGPTQSPNTRSQSKTEDKVGTCLLDHIDKYTAHGFKITRVTCDGEPGIKAVKSQLLQRQVELNVLGHGSQTAHAESAIRHVKNKARSTALNLPYVMPTRWVSPLLNFVVHAINLVPMSYSPHQISAYTTVAVYGIPGITGIPDVAPKGISGIHGSRYTHIRLSLTGCRYSEDALPPSITWCTDTE